MVRVLCAGKCYKKPRELSGCLVRDLARPRELSGGLVSDLARPKEHQKFIATTHRKPPNGHSHHTQTRTHTRTQARTHERARERETSHDAPHIQEPILVRICAPPPTTTTRAHAAEGQPF